MDVVKIIAKDAKEFEATSKMVQKLPEKIRSQIFSAEKTLLGIECNFRIKPEFKQRFFLLRDTKSIVHSNTEVTIACEEYFFRIPEAPKDYNFEFYFIDDEQHK